VLNPKRIAAVHYVFEESDVYVCVYNVLKCVGGTIYLEYIYYLTTVVYYNMHSKYTPIYLYNTYNTNSYYVYNQ
jgi:hypothetical protein